MAISKIKKSIQSATPATPATVQTAQAFFKACADMKANRKAMRNSLCAFLVACMGKAEVKLDKCEGLTAATAARMDRMAAASAKLEFDYSKKERNLRIVIVDANFTPAQVEELKKGRLPKRFEVEQDVDLDKLAKRIQGMLEGLEADDINKVLETVMNGLEQAEQA